MPPSKNKVAQSLQKDIADPIYDDFATFIQAMPVLLPFCQARFVMCKDLLPFPHSRGNRQMSLPKTSLSSKGRKDIIEGLDSMFNSLFKLSMGKGDAMTVLYTLCLHLIL